MRTLFVLPLVLAAGVSMAEIKLPQASPAATLVQEIGISRVTITYHRPAVKARKVWGELVPLGEVWRLGANNATTVELSHDARIDGNTVPAGKYALFAIPAPSEWTFILNRKHDQWGAYFHKPEEDQLRFKVVPQPAELTEWFDIDATPLNDRALRVEVAWEKVRLPFTIEFDTTALVWKQIESKLATPEATWEDYHQAARYAMQTNSRLDEAMKWVDKAMETESFWNYELKALLLHKAGRDDEARPLMLKAKELARGKAPQGYLDGLDKEMSTWK